MSENGTSARDSITIAGEVFKVNRPYTEGHTLTAGEASALNQTRAENLRNNFASKVKAAKDGGAFDLEVMQSEFDQYAEEYEFGERSGGGGRTSDPVQSLAMDMMRDKVRAAIKKSGASLKDTKPADITARAKAEFDKNSPIAQQLLQIARDTVTRQQEIATLALDAA